MPGPPVAKIRLMCGWCISALESGMVGFSIQPIMPSGAPAATAASNTILAAAMVHFLARGWGENTIPLRVLRASKLLKIAVAVGLVVGTTPAITPIGSATLR